MSQDESSAAVSPEDASPPVVRRAVPDDLRTNVPLPARLLTVGLFSELGTSFLVRQQETLVTHRPARRMLPQVGGTVAQPE